MNATVIPTMVPTVQRILFSLFDYCLFGSMLGLSILIGIYFGCFGSKQNSTSEYLLGGKSMKILPIAISLTASHVSGITLLAVPADIYKYGASYWWICLSIVLICVITRVAFLPVFYKLQLISTFEYLKIRFHHKVRTLASAMFAIQIFIHVPIVVYIPALAFAQATGTNIHIVVPIICAVCIFYTTIGGLKAVVWSDTLQFSLTVVALVTVFYMGIQSAGGIGEIFHKSVEGERLIFDFDLDPTKRDSFWTVFIGSTFTWFSVISVNQLCMQKFLALPTVGDANKSLLLFGMGMIIVKTINVLTGLIMYTKYADCDPFTTKVVEKTDQLLPYYVMDVAGNIPGLPGIFIAGVFGAALSSLASCLNTVAGTIYKDFINPFMPKDTTEQTASNILKLIVVISGVICTFLVFVVEKMGGILPFVISFNGLTGGPLCGLFLLGLFYPKATTRGAFYGGIISLICMSFIVFGSQYYKSQGIIHYDEKPMSVRGCLNGNYTDLLSAAEPATTHAPCESSQPFVLFRISYYYYSMIGIFVTVSIGCIITWASREDDPPVHPDLISPVAQYFIPKNCYHEKGSYNTIRKALEVVQSNQEDSEKKMEEMQIQIKS